MGRYYFGNKDTTEQAKRIELSWLRKHDYLCGYRGGNIQWSVSGTPTGKINVTIDTYSDSPNIKLNYKVRKHGDEEWTDIDFSFRMESTPCRFGGKKWYFICGLYRNNVYCGRRARILYQTGNYFGCRKCADLTYGICNESKRSRVGFWKIWSNESRAEEYYIKNVKRHFYAGKPTKKYKRYLEIGGDYSDRDMVEIQNTLLNMGQNGSKIV